MTDIGIDEKNSAQVVKILSRVLADEYVLYTKTRGYHWNVTGMQFNDFHKFFEAQYTVLEGIVDDVAERARTIRNEGSTNAAPVRLAPSPPPRTQPRYMASCAASGPGASWENASPSAYSRCVIHPRRSTRSRCM